MMEDCIGSGGSPKFFSKILEYPDGSYDICCSSCQVFGPKQHQPCAGAAEDPGPTKAPEENLAADGEPAEPVQKPEPKPENVERARVRARAAVRRFALCNDFRWFVTLTIDPAKVDSLDEDLVIRRLSQWCSNQVKRRDLTYVLVPERHQSGRIHFHGFFSDSFPVVDSGHKDRQGHTVYNLPAWAYGFTTAIELYGDRRAAIGYCCKYIGKDCEKIGGRWYYSGGDKHKPVEHYCDVTYAELLAMQDEEFTERYGTGWQMATPAGLYAGVNGLVGGLPELLQQYGSLNNSEDVSRET